jgi:hypothetical protein
VTANSVDTVKDFGKPPSAIVARWIAEIDLFEKETEDWRKRADKIVTYYRDEREDVNQFVRRFALLWSNVETLKPVLYARLPKADVQRRFKDSDPVARLASEIAERALDYTIDCTDRFNQAMQEVVEDYLLVAQGVTWKRYVPHFKQQTPRIAVFQRQTEGVAEDGVGISNDTRTNDVGEYEDIDGNVYSEVEQDEQGPFVNGEPVDVVEYEEVVTDYINYKDFGRNAGARTWDEVYAVWRKAYLTRDELKERFGDEIGSKIPLDYEPKKNDKTVNDDTRDLFKKATIYEIWDRSTKKAYWIHKMYPEGPLDMRDDPLGLSDFFPCPRPLWATQTNNTLVPIPDYIFYQDQDKDIQGLTGRISILQKAVRVRGLYPANVDSVRTLLQDADDNDMVPVDQNVLLAMNISDLSKAVFFWPIDQLVAAIKTLIEIRRQMLEDVYQITGISDILRGSTEADETATAQQLKAQWGSIRVKDRQKEIQRFARDNIRIDFEIIFNHFDPQTIVTMTNIENLPEVQQNPQILPAAIALLKNKALRHFKVDIETDSTSAPDEQAEKQSAVEFLTSFMQGLDTAGKILPLAPELAPAVGEAMMFTARRFKASATLESTIEQGMKALQDRIAQSLQQPQQDPAAQMEAQMAQQEGQLRMAEMQQEGQLRQGEQQLQAADLQLQARGQQIEEQRLQLDAVALAKDPNPQSNTVN